jgi:DNA-binding response OmpR family regulator
MAADQKVAYGAAKKRLLVIDDEVPTCEFIMRIASKTGFEVAGVVSPEQFAGSYDAFDPTAILLDLVMPKMDGIAVMEILAEKSCNAGLMIMSGYHPELLNAAQRIAAGHGLDIRGILRKPFGAAELEDALRSLS